MKKLKEFKTVKTPKASRDKYTYYFKDGGRVMLEAGKVTTKNADGEISVAMNEDITEITLKQLHAMDDADVYQNLKQKKAYMPSERRKELKEWYDAHSDKPQKELWCIHFSNFINSETDEEINESRNPYFADISTLNGDFDEPSDQDRCDIQRESLLDYVDTLPKSQQELYRLHYIEGWRAAELSRKFGISKAAMNHRIERIETTIKKYFQKNL